MTEIRKFRKPVILFICICLICSSLSYRSHGEALPSELFNASAAWEDITAGVAEPEQYYSGKKLSAVKDAAIQALADGTYYLNGKYSGDYLRYDSGALNVKSGLVSASDMGTKIRWALTQTSSGYTIRSVSNPTVYLCVPSSAGSFNVESVTVPSGSTVPSRCYWEISIADGGGCLVKNSYNFKYLCTYGEADGLETASTTGTVGYENYYAKVWRITSPSYMAGRELTVSTKFHDCYLMMGYSDIFKYRKSPSNAIWADYRDFTYSIANSNIISMNTKTGEITPKAAGTTTVAVTHRVTNISRTLNVRVLATSTYKGTLSSWADIESNMVGYWSTPPKIFTEKIDSSSTFYFNTGCNTARNTWNTALGISMNTTSNADSADIKIYGGSYAQLLSRGGNLSPGTTGLTVWTSIYIPGITNMDQMQRCNPVLRLQPYIFCPTGPRQTKIKIHALTKRDML